MKSPTLSFRHLTATIVSLVVLGLAADAAESPGWAGQYTDQKFLNGRAVFQLTIEQSGSKMQVSFDAAWVDDDLKHRWRIDWTARYDSLRAGMESAKGPR